MKGTVTVPKVIISDHFEAIHNAHFVKPKFSGFTNVVVINPKSLLQLSDQELGFRVISSLSGAFDNQLAKNIAQLIGSKKNLEDINTYRFLIDQTDAPLYRSALESLSQRTDSDSMHAVAKHLLYPVNALRPLTT